MTADGDESRGGPREDAGGAPDAGATDAVLRHAEGQPPRPGEEELFAALDRTRAELAAAPPPPLPTGFAAQLQERLAAERAAAASGHPGQRPAHPPATGRPVPSSPRGPSRPPREPDGRGARGPARRRRRLLAAGLGVLAVVAAVTGGLLAGAGRDTAPAPTAAPGTRVPAPAPAPVSTADPARALRAGLGARDPGPLADPARRATCLVAHGLAPGTVPLGSRQVVIDGRPGTLLVLSTGTAARFRLLVVGPDCAVGRPDTLADLTVGG